LTINRHYGEKTKITKECFMKRKTILKLTAFVLFGMCLLSTQKAEATLTPLQQAADDALKSNKTLFCELLLIFERNHYGGLFVKAMGDVCRFRNMCAKKIQSRNVFSKSDIDEAKRLRDEPKRLRDALLTDAQAKDLKHLEEANNYWDEFVASIEGGGEGGGISLSSSPNLNPGFPSSTSSSSFSSSFVRSGDDVIGVGGGGGGVISEVAYTSNRLGVDGGGVSCVYNRIWRNTHGLSTDYMIELARQVALGSNERMWLELASMNRCINRCINSNGNSCSLWVKKMFEMYGVRGKYIKQEPGADKDKANRLGAEAGDLFSGLKKEFKDWRILEKKVVRANEPWYRWCVLVDMDNEREGGAGGGGCGAYLSSGLGFGDEGGGRFDSNYGSSPNFSSPGSSLNPIASTPSPINLTPIEWQEGKRTIERLADRSDWINKEMSKRKVQTKAMWEMVALSYMDVVTEWESLKNVLWMKDSKMNDELSQVINYLDMLIDYAHKKMTEAEKKAALLPVSTN
jgi:hypothetical protein